MFLQVCITRYDICADNGRGQRRGVVRDNMDNSAGQMAARAEIGTEQQPDTSGMTIADICRETGKSSDTFGKGWRRAYARGLVSRPFSASLVPTAKEVSAVSALRNALGGVADPKPKPAKRSVAAAQVVPESGPRTTAKPAKRLADDWGESLAMLIFPSIVTALSVALTVCGLFMFAQWAGALLGSMFGFVLVCAVIVARNRMKGATSEQALNTVFWMELGAFALHCFTFYKLMPAFPEGLWWQMLHGALAAACGGFASFLSYRAVIMVRNYNAEV